MAAAAAAAAAAGVDQLQWCVLMLNSALALLNAVLACGAAAITIVVSTIHAQSLSVTVKRRFINYLLLFSVFEMRTSAAPFGTRPGEEGSGADVGLGTSMGHRRLSTELSFTRHGITTSADGAMGVFAIDVDGDGDIDVDIHTSAFSYFLFAQSS